MSHRTGAVMAVGKLACMLLPRVVAISGKTERVSKVGKSTTIMLNIEMRHVVVSMIEWY